MQLAIGIVGLPNVGKSTLFNALTKKSVPAENYPFCTIDPSIGIVPVPDPRVDQLATLSKSKKKIPAVVEFVDIAGLIKGAAQGEGLGNAFLTNIRDVHAIAEVVRIFDDPNIIHVSGKVEPVEDITTIEYELALADLATVEKRLTAVEHDKKRGVKGAETEHAMLERVQKALTEGRLANSVPIDEKEAPYLHSLHLLTAKPLLYVLNKKSVAPSHGQERAGVRWEKNEQLLRLKKLLDERQASWVTVDAVQEAELSQLTPEEEAVFREELNAKESGLEALIKKSYELLGLMSYFTTGEDETRAWTIKKGSTAPEAGAAIHTDFKEKFIRAEVVKAVDLMRAGSYAKARELGLVRTEGKDYVVQDGDVIEFRI